MASSRFESLSSTPSGLRSSAWTGLISRRLANERPRFKSAHTYQRTSYLPGEISQLDWWQTGRHIAVGKGASREAFGLVATLPHSAGHATMFTLSKTMADFCPALVGCFQRLGGVTDKAIVFNDTSTVASREGGTARRHDEVASIFGHLECLPVPLEPRRPQSKGQVERTIGYLETSFPPLLTFASLDDRVS